MTSTSADLATNRPPFSWRASNQWKIFRSHLLGRIFPISISLFVAFNWKACIKSLQLDTYASVFSKLIAIVAEILLFSSNSHRHPNDINLMSSSHMVPQFNCFANHPKSNFNPQSFVLTKSRKPASFISDLFILFLFNRFLFFIISYFPSSFSF